MTTTMPSPAAIVGALLGLLVLWPTMIAVAGFAKATVGRTRPRTAELVSTVLYVVTCVTTMGVGAWIGGAFH